MGYMYILVEHIYSRLVKTREIKKYKRKEAFCSNNKQVPN